MPLPVLFISPRLRSRSSGIFGWRSFEDRILCFCRLCCMLLDFSSSDSPNPRCPRTMYEHANWSPWKIHSFALSTPSWRYSDPSSVSQHAELPSGVWNLFFWKFWGFRESFRRHRASSQNVRWRCSLKYCARYSGYNYKDPRCPWGHHTSRILGRGWANIVSCLLRWGNLQVSSNELLAFPPWLYVSRRKRGTYPKTHSAILLLLPHLPKGGYWLPLAPRVTETYLAISRDGSN